MNLLITIASGSAHCGACRFRKRIDRNADGEDGDIVRPDTDGWEAGSRYCVLFDSELGGSETTEPLRLRACYDAEDAAR